MSDDIYDGVDGEDVVDLYEELAKNQKDFANAKNDQQKKFKEKYGKKYGPIRNDIMNQIVTGKITKAEGGIVGLFMGGSAMSGGDLSDAAIGSQIDDYEESQNNNDNDNIISGSRDDVDALKARDKANQETYEEARKYYQDTLDNSPQVGSRLRSEIEKAIKEGRFGDIELESGFGPSNKTMVTGVYNPVGQLPGLFGLAQQLLGGAGGKGIVIIRYQFQAS